MWFYLVTLVGLYYLLCWYRERQVVSHLHDKYVFITGCDSGFGKLLARQLDMRGMRVLAACLTENGAEQLRKKTSDRLETVILDVTKSESVAAATQWVKDRVGDKDGGYYRVPQLVSHRDSVSERCPAISGTSTVEPLHLRLMEHSRTGGRDNTEASSTPISSVSSCDRVTGTQKVTTGQGLWGLVNNAGVFQSVTYLEWQKIEDLINILQVNLIGLVQVTLSMLPLVKRAQGRIINVSSALGRIAFIGGFYTCSKYGVEAFSDILRREIQDFGVKVSIIQPGSFRTGMTDTKVIMEKLKKLWEETPPNIKESYGQQFFDDFCRTTKQGLEKCSTNLSLVTDCMEHALTSVHPRIRYAAGWDALLFFIPLSYLPVSLADCILTKYRCKPAQAV